MSDKKTKFDSMKIRDVIHFLEEAERRGAKQVIMDTQEVGVGSINFMTMSQDDEYAIIGWGDKE